MELHRILHFYEKASGQKINRDKSVIYFSCNTSTQIRQAVCSILGMREEKDNGIYLGLPSTCGKSKKTIFAGVKDRMRRTSWIWNGKLLSFAGKEVLTKAVLQAIPLYIMSCFRLP